MVKYVGKRLVAGLLAVILAVCINFVLIRLAPGDPVRVMAGHDNPNPEMVAALTEKYGLDKPILTQFGLYMSNLVKGDFGYSYRNNQPVINLIAERIFPTLLLTVTAIALSFLIGTAIGLLAARKEGTALDNFLNGISYLFDSMPSFWLALMLIMVFASGLGWFPTSGMVTLRTNYSGFKHVLDVLKHLVLPATCLTLLYIPQFFRITRASMMQVMNEDYVTLFRASGMREKSIFSHFVFKNGILTPLTMLGMYISYAFTGSVFVETVFAWPGMGRLLYDSIFKRDYPVITGIYIVVCLIIAIVTILLDVIYAYLDPRIRLK